MTAQGRNQIGVFISYSHHDASWLARLRVHLKPLEQNYHFDVWDDTRIIPGSRWRDEIKEALDSCKAAILLLSADFLASDFIMKEEIPVILSAADEKGILVLPIIVSRCSFEDNSVLSKYQSANPPSRPLNGMTRSKREDALYEVYKILKATLATPESKALDKARPLDWAEMQPLYFEPFDAADANIDPPEVLKERFHELWLPYNEELWSATITGGTYILSNSADPYAVRYKYLRVNERDMADAPVSVEVKADIADALFPSGAGLIYRFNRETKSYYIFVLSGDNRFVFYRRDEEGYKSLYSEYSTAINPGQFNKLAIIGKGAELKLYINDSLVKIIVDTELKAGDMGIAAMGEGKFYFDNLTIYQWD